MFAKSILVCFFALTLIYATSGSRSLMVVGDSSGSINEIIQDFLGGGSSPTTISEGLGTSFPDILQISTGDDDSDDDDGGNPFQGFFERVQSLADEPGSVLGSIFEGSGIDISELLGGAGY
eukprot:TRINITY_DN210_c0_g1_i2.p5 TRINITY_DN210_c0_g1~~TRINITY_DN210_c0_g1_i2.p5  ORF type:complete len:121 (-),score=19.72 TRINITY_DN210_c0_g1_i2:928-1290(-)